MLVQLRNLIVADAEWVMEHESKTKPPILWQGGGGPSESTGRGMQEEIRRRTREALSPEEIRQQLHELRVLQIELEMQNEELRRAHA